jgi:cob(I)alamin adenosyltransferase
MPRLTKIYTRSGDNGKTGLGGGQRVAKDAPRIEAYGTVDELNSFIGMAIEGSGTRESLPLPSIREKLLQIQNDLFDLGGDLCLLEEDRIKYKVSGVGESHITRLETWIDHLQENQKDLENFILPSGTPQAAMLHVCRCVCRRAERATVHLMHLESVPTYVLQYLNRLSDLLFVMAREENLGRNIPEVLWRQNQ